MKKLEKRLSSGLTSQQRERVQKLINFWKAVQSCRGTPGETHLRVLDGLLAEFTDILSREPLDLNRAEAITAEAALRITGRRNV